MILSTASIAASAVAISALNASGALPNGIRVIIKWFVSLPEEVKLLITSIILIEFATETFRAFKRIIALNFDKEEGK